MSSPYQGCIFAGPIVVKVLIYQRLQRQVVPGTGAHKANPGNVLRKIWTPKVPT